MRNDLTGGVGWVEGARKQAGKMKNEALVLGLVKRHDNGAIL